MPNGPVLAPACKAATWACLQHGKCKMCWHFHLWGVQAEIYVKCVDTFTFWVSRLTFDPVGPGHYHLQVAEQCMHDCLELMHLA